MASGRLKSHICILTRRELKHDSRIARIAATLVQAGARVSIVAESSNRELPEREEGAAGHKILRVFRRPAELPRRDGSAIRPSPLRAAWQYLRRLRTHLAMFRHAYSLNADVYHASDLVPLPVAWLVSRLRSRPLVYDAREISTDREAYQRFRRLVSLVEGTLARGADGFITTTDMRAEVFAAQYGITRTTVLQNRPEAPASEQAAVNLHRSLEIPDGQLIFLYQGGLQQGRGLEQILDAAAETDGACFVFIGSGALDPALRAKAAQLGIEDRVRIHAAVPWQELASWTAGADVGLQLLQNTCLNHYTTDSNKIFEYAVAGLPVVASDFPEIRKIVSSWGFGLLVDPSNHQELVERFRALVSDEPLRQQLKEAALRAAPELTWNTQAPLLIDLYEKIDESRARRARA